MTRKQRLKSFLYQQGQSDCGVACLKSILQYYGGDCSLERLREYSGTTPQGTTLLGLCQAAIKIGFEAEGLQADKIDNLRELEGPAILHVLIDKRLYHYVIFYGFVNDACLIGDPAKGIVSLSYQELDQIWASRILLSLTATERIATVKQGIITKRKWMWELVKEDITLLSVTSGLGVVIATLGISTAIFSQKLIDEILPNHETRRLWIGLVLLTTLLIIKSLISSIRGKLIIQQSRAFNGRIINTFYYSLLHLPKSFFDSRKTGDIIARLNDTRRIQQTITYLTGNVIINILVTIIFTIALMTYSLVVGSIAIVTIPMFFSLAYYFNKTVVTNQQEVMSKYAHTESYFIESIQGISTIKNHHVESISFKAMHHKYAQYLQQQYNLGNTNIKITFCSDLINICTLITILTISSWKVSIHQLQIGEMMAILTLTGNILPAIGSLALTNLQVQEARIAF